MIDHAILSLDENQYFKEKTQKNAIVLHHTAGSDDPRGVVSWWNHTPEKVATAYIIDRKGIIYSCFDDQFWAHHLGLRSNFLQTLSFAKSNTELNKMTIGIELTNWGPLTKNGNKYYTYTNKEIKSENVADLKKIWRGYRYFEKYTLPQLESAIKLIKYLIEKHKIKIVKPKNYTEIFDININALRGVPGIYSHSSYRNDKTDCYPDEDLIKMLNQNFL